MPTSANKDRREFKQPIASFYFAPDTLCMVELLVVRLDPGMVHLEAGMSCPHQSLYENRRRHIVLVFRRYSFDMAKYSTYDKSPAATNGAIKRMSSFASSYAKSSNGFDMSSSKPLGKM